MLIVILIFRAPLLAAADTAVWVRHQPAVAAIALLAGRLVYTFVKPYRECRWCRPGGLIGGSMPVRLLSSRPDRRRRWESCWRCKGTRLTRRLGGYHVHKVRLSLLQAWDEREWWR